MPTIIEMVNHTRLDCVLGCDHRHARRASPRRSTTPPTARSSAPSLVDQPLMQNVLADLAVESEAATIAAMRLARAYDEAIAGDAEAQSLKRVANAVLKYWITKRAPAHAGECLECLGGNGYVEESGMPRLFRESPLNSIWEGSGNVQCLDVLRAMVKSPGLGRVLLRRGRRRRRRRAPPRRLRRRPARRTPRRRRHDRDPRPPRGRTDGPRPPGLPPGPLRRRSRRRRLLRLPPHRRLGPSLRHPPRGPRLRRASSTATAPSPERLQGFTAGPRRLGSADWAALGQLGPK